MPTRRGLSLRVARVAGIDVRVHASFLLIVWLVTLAAADPGGPGAGGAFRWLGIVFGSVLVHEFAHSILARRRGATVRAIVLLPIGGVSQIENMPTRPGDRLAIAIVGPLTSFALAGVAAMAAFGTGTALLPRDFYGGLDSVLWINLMLGGFNLLPAFPLDGGRVLHAILEQHMNPLKATRIAAAVGRTLAVGMIAYGLLNDNVWLAVIGAFVFMAASAEESGARIHERMEGLRARDVMLIDPATLAAERGVDEIRDGLPTQAQRDFPVVREDLYVGMVSAEALERAAAGARVWQVMNAGAPTVGPDDPLEAVVLPTLARPHREAVAVLDGHAVVGLITLERVRRATAGRDGAPRGND